MRGLPERAGVSLEQSANCVGCARLRYSPSRCRRLSGLELEQVALAGHSLAAHVVALYAGTRSERVRALVLLNPRHPSLPNTESSSGKK